MNKAAKIIAIIIILILIILTHLDCNKHKTKNTFKFPETIQVKNYTAYESIDTMVMLAVNKIFNYDTIAVSIHYTKNSFLSNDKFIVYAYIQKDIYTNHTYFIFLSKERIPSIEIVLAHELVHLKQLESGELVQFLFMNTVTYKGEIINLATTEYEKRLYEIDAFKEENTIKNKLNELLYTEK